MGGVSKVITIRLIACSVVRKEEASEQSNAIAITNSLPLLLLPLVWLLLLIFHWKKNKLGETPARVRPNSFASVTGEIRLSRARKRSRTRRSFRERCKKIRSFTYSNFYNLILSKLLNSVVFCDVGCLQIGSSKKLPKNT